MGRMLAIRTAQPWGLCVAWDPTVSCPAQSATVLHSRTGGSRMVLKDPLPHPSDKDDGVDKSTESRNGPTPSRALAGSPHRLLPRKLVAFLRRTSQQRLHSRLLFRHRCGAASTTTGLLGPVSQARHMLHGAEAPMCRRVGLHTGQAPS